MVRAFVAVCSMLAITMRFANAEVFTGTPITMVKSTEWEVEYPLPRTCNDGGYSVSLTIDVEAISTGEADLVLAFGTASKYFSMAISYDSGLWVNTDTQESGTLFAAPQSGLSFFSGDVSTMYAPLWRQSLAEDAMSNWEKLVEEGSVMGRNVGPLFIDILSDAGTTTVTVTKGGVSGSVQYASTFPASTPPTLYMATDSAHTNDEVITLNSITVDDLCQWLDSRPLPQTCDDSNYELSLSIDILALTDEADLVLALGTDTTYFGAVIGYDGGLWVQSVAAGSSAAYATSTFINGDVTTAYAYNWRTSLAGGDASNWTPLDVIDNPLGQNIGPLTIDIVSDAVAGTTTVTFTKVIGAKSIIYNSVFPALSTPVLYWGSDPMHPQERFELTSITDTLGDCAPICEANLKTYIDECYCSGELGFDAKAQVPLIDAGLTEQDVAGVMRQLSAAVNAQTQSDMVMFAGCMMVANFLMMSLMLCGYKLSAKGQHVHSLLVPQTDAEDNVLLK